MRWNWGSDAMTDEKVRDFYEKMVSAGVLEDGIDWQAAFTTEFTNKRGGMDIK